jgi:hypothetical protein
MRVMTLVMDLMGRISTASRILFCDELDDFAMVLDATWVHPPGAAHRSMITLAFSKK